MNSARQSWLVAVREIRERGRSRAFLASLLLMLLAVAAAIALPALLDGMLGLLEAVLPEGERHLAGEVFDGADLVEGLAETVGDQPLEGLSLDGDEIGDGEDLGDLAEGES